ncbi:MAG: ribosome biogenesis GTP-binding protein YihA/YsxC [Acidimicrobiales bacterium]
MSGGPLALRFVLSAPSIAELPETAAEVAIVGRSNVGKSSIINSLSARKNLAITSNTPGRTRLLNVFELEGSGTPPTALVDLPGYGYAKVSASMRSDWGRMIETYLLEREQLAMIISLIDAEVGPTKLDVQMLDWMRSTGLPHQVVATKHDKVRSSKRQKRKAELAAGCMLEPRDIVWASAHKNTGIDQLRGLVRSWLSPSV